MLKMGSLLLEAEITGKELLRQLKAGAGGGAKYKKQYDYENTNKKKSMTLLKCAWSWKYSAWILQIIYIVVVKLKF